MADIVEAGERLDAALGVLEGLGARSVWPVRKEEAPCCVALRDADGRLPIGFCSPECVRRPQRAQDHAQALEEAAQARRRRLVASLRWWRPRRAS